MYTEKPYGSIFNNSTTYHDNFIIKFITTANNITKINDLHHLSKQMIEVEINQLISLTY